MNPSKWSHPSLILLTGQFVTLKPLDPNRDASPLYEISHGTPEKEAVWKYLPYGPFPDAPTMKEWLIAEMHDKVDPLPWTVFDNKTNSQVGVVSFLAIQPTHGRAEIGNVWFAPIVHKTKINTESQFLLLQHLFDTHQYRRAEWKCDSLNHASRTTAARMGFTFEGRFRQHMFIRGKNRDTDWFAMLNKDWPCCKANFQTWLYSTNPPSLSELNNP